MKTTVLIKLDERDPDLSKVREVARACREGKIAAFPTETVYGIGAPMTVPHAVEILAHIKKREADKPFSYHIGDWEMLDRLSVVRTPVFRFLSRRFWPGPLTLLVKNQAGENIGIRFPRHRLAVALFNAAGEPFIATSANLTGAPSPHTAEEVMSQLGGQIDYLIDGGRSELAQDSTVLDLTDDTPGILRRGAAVGEVEKALEKVRIGKFPKKRVLLVCTGNSCRSPMAAGWIEQELHSKGLGDKIEVASCGIGARSGAPATSEAILVMKNREIDISEHRSKPCTREDVLEADLILAMSQEHYQFIVGMVPSAKDRVKVFDIPDPIGLGMMIYEQVMAGLEKRLKNMWEDIIAGV